MQAADNLDIVDIVDIVDKLLYTMYLLPPPGHHQLQLSVNLIII